jgi:hypothetical protein
MRTSNNVLIAWFLVGIAPGALCGATYSPADATVFVSVTGAVRVVHKGYQQPFVEGRIEISTGSGFIISPNGHILTNHHLVNDREYALSVEGKTYQVSLFVESIDVSFPSVASTHARYRRLPANIVAADPVLDLAVIAVMGADLPYVLLGDSDAVAPGERVGVLGFPFGKRIAVGTASLPDIIPQVSLSRGSMSALRYDEEGRARYLQTDANLNPGNSGGPLINEEGYAIGVIKMNLKHADGIGFAIPVNVVKDFLEAHGLDWIFPCPRISLRFPQGLDGKGVRLRLPYGFEDVSSSPWRVSARGIDDSLELRIDRIESTSSLDRIEEALLREKHFDRFFGECSDRRFRHARDQFLLLGHAKGYSSGYRESLAMEYAIVDLGREKIVARYIGPAEKMAFNLSRFRDSLSSIEAERLLGDERVPVH